MSEAAIVTIIVGILGILGGGGVWAYLGSRHEEPIKKKEADIAAASSVNEMALAFAEDVREEMGNLREDLKTEAGRRKMLEQRVDDLWDHVRKQDRTIRTLRAALQVFQEAWADLILRWDVLRLQDKPPSMPRPPTD